MIKNKKIALTLGMALSVLCFCACGNGNGSVDVASTAVSDTPSVSAATSEPSAASVSAEPGTDDEAGKSEQINGNEQINENEQGNRNEQINENEQISGNEQANANEQINGNEQDVPPTADDGYVKKTQYADDENGIYSFTIVLNDTVPTEGLVELLFYGMNGDTETQVCCYEAKYEREDNGLYEIRRFYDGNVDLNDHQKQELKVPVTFGAAVRATRVEATLIVNDSERIPLYSLNIRE